MNIQKLFRFEASHILPRHPGKCKNLHGHSWVLRLGVSGHIDPRTGFVLDYGELNQVMDPLVAVMDHNHLNFLFRYPSSEVIVGGLGTIVGRLRCPALPQVTLQLSETAKVDCTHELEEEGSPCLRLALMPTWEEFCSEPTIVVPTRAFFEEVQARWKAAIKQAIVAADAIKEAKMEAWRAGGSR